MTSVVNVPLPSRTTSYIQFLHTVTQEALDPVQCISSHAVII